MGEDKNSFSTAESAILDSLINHIQAFTLPAGLHSDKRVSKSTGGWSGDLHDLALNVRVGERNFGWGDGVFVRVEVTLKRGEWETDR